MSSASSPPARDDLAPSSDGRRAFLSTAVDVLQLRGSTAEQFRRYVGEFLAWCEANHHQPSFDEPLRTAYREHLEATGVLGRPKAWERRASYLNKLAAATAGVMQRDRISASRWRTRLIDALPHDSELRRGIETIMAGARGGYRASLRADLAVVLEWCEASGLDPTELGPAEVQRFDAWLRCSGRRSRGPEFAARRLQRHFHQPDRWWK
jgi:hypothetical protein